MREAPVSAACALASALLAAALASGRPATPPPAVAAPAAGAARLLWGQPLDLNREDADALTALPGIGPARARAIVESRPLCRLGDLGRVPGIGPATSRRLAGKVTVGPSACSH